MKLVKNSVKRVLEAMGLRISRLADPKAFKSRYHFLGPLWACYGLPKVFVETGTYRGATTAAAAECFEEVHTIELSPRWHRRAVRKFRSLPHVHCHLGDSGEVLAQLASTLDRAAFFYLDAHFSGGTTAMGSEEVPLLRELRILGGRRHPDLIVIDDFRLFGESGECGEGSREWPCFGFDWRHITRESVMESLGRPCTVDQHGDRLVLWIRDSETRRPVTSTG